MVPRSLALASFLSLLVLPGCSLFGSSDKNELEEEPAEELKLSKENNIDKPEAELFADAKRQYSSRLYSVSRESFEAIRDNYPLGAYAEFAEIKAADSYFESSEFGTAATLYEDFSKNRPASPALDYVLLRAGRSYELSNKGVGRDPVALGKALELYTRLLGDFPDSIYAESARVYKEAVDSKLAEQEKAVIDFYRKKGKDAAVNAREASFQQRWGQKSDQFVSKKNAAADLQERVRAADISAPVSVETISIAGDEEISEITDNGITGEIITDQPPAEAPEQSRPPTQASMAAAGGVQEGNLPNYSGPGVVRSVGCNADSQIVTIFLDEPLPTKSLLGSAPTSGGRLDVTIEGLRTPDGNALVQDCFSTQDLSLSAKGELILKTDAARAVILELSNPARLMLALKK